MCHMWSNLPSRTSFLPTINFLPGHITVIPAQSITGVCGSKPNQRRTGSFPTRQKNAPSCGVALGMTDAVTLSAPSRLPTSRPPALQRIWTGSTRSRVRAPLWRNEREFQYVHDAGCFRSCFVVPFSARLSFPENQTINISCCRSESGDLIFVFSSLLSLVFTLCGRDTPPTTCHPFVMEHVLFRSVAGYPSVIEYVCFCFAPLRILQAAGRLQFVFAKLPGKATCSQPTRTVS